MSKFDNKRFASSMLAIVGCLVVFCYGTFAFFRSEAVNSGNVIQTATYVLNVTYAGENAGITITDGTYTVNETGAYEFTLSATGDSTGYCKITVVSPGSDEGQLVTDTYYTEQIAPSTSITLQVNAIAASLITFEPIWGTYQGDGALASTDGVIIIGTLPEAQVLFMNIPQQTEEYTLYTVSDGDTLESIAQANGLDVAELITYNEFDENTQIAVGQEIMIPKQSAEGGGSAAADVDGTNGGIDDNTDGGTAEGSDSSVEGTNNGAAADVSDADSNASDESGDVKGGDSI